MERVRTGPIRFILLGLATSRRAPAANLKKQIEGIMTNRFTRELTFGRKLLLTVAAVAAVSGPIVIGLLNPPHGRAQTQATAPPSFEVASVKTIRQTWIDNAPTRSPGRFTWTTNLLNLVQYAYHMRGFQISGQVSDGEFVYRVDATMAPTATEDEVRLMLRSLLADRFKMVAHRVTKDGEGYNLSIGRGGPKIHEAKEGDQPPPLPDVFRGGSPTPAEVEGKVVEWHGAGTGIVMAGRRVSMLQLCTALQRVLNTVVWDDTGLKGNYYFALRYAREDAPEEADADAPSLLAAIQENLGLKLEKHKGPVEMLVVDHIEKNPTEN